MTIKTKIVPIALALSMAFGAPALPALADEGHTGDHAATPAPAAKLPAVSGKVTKIDESAGKITIDHQAIPNLSMDAMTMVFKAGDPAQLKAVKPGDAVKFTADKMNGQLTVMSIEKGK